MIVCAKDVAGRPGSAHVPADEIRQLATFERSVTAFNKKAAAIGDRQRFAVQTINTARSSEAVDMNDQS